MEVLEEKVTRLEEMMMRLLYLHQKNEIETQRLREETEKEKREIYREIAEMQRQMKESAEEFRKDLKLMGEEFDRKLQQDREEFDKRMQQQRQQFLEEIRISREEFDRRMQEQRQQFIEEIRASREEFEKKLQQDREEFDKRMQQQRQQLDEELERRHKNWEKEFKEEVRNMNKRWGEISNKLGTIVEDIIFPATEPVLSSYFKCYIDDLQLNRKKKKDGLKDEFDVIAVSETCKTVFLIEVKSTPKIDYINEFKDKKVERFKKLFPEYSNYKLILIFASLRLEDDIVNYLTKHGIYAMAYREWEYMDILNFEEINKSGGQT